METDTTKKPNEEVSLLDVIRVIWSSRRLIIFITLSFLILGIIIAFTSAKVYNASCILVPQTGQKQSTSKLSGLASLAGIDMGDLSSGELLSPRVYPNIINSVKFRKDLMYSKYKFSDIEDSVTLYDFYTDEKYQKFSLGGVVLKYTIGLPILIIDSFKGEDDTSSKAIVPTNIEVMTFKEDLVSKKISKSVLLSLQDKDGYISINSYMSDPLVAAQLAQRAQELLQQYITEFKLEKISSKLEFLQGRYDVTYNDYINKQIELARYRDSNKGIVSAITRTNEDRLASEFTLAFSIFSEVAKQLEQTKIAVKDETPILTVVNPVFVPLDKVKPRKSIIIMALTFIGFIVSLGTVVIREFYWSDFVFHLKGGDDSGI